jgi:hypothetical protein
MNKMLFRPNNLTSGAVVAIMVMGVVSLAGQDFRAPRGPDAKPDLNGIWQALNEANYDIEAHVARSAMALRPAPYGPVPAAAVLALGAVGAVPPSLGVVEGGEIPYKPEGLARRTQNQQDWLNLDPEIKCYLPGVPRHLHALPISDSAKRERTDVRVRIRRRREEHLSERPWPRSGRLVDGPVSRTLGG